MRKQHNRGQDGAGIATVKLNTRTWLSFYTVCAAMPINPLQFVFAQIGKEIDRSAKISARY
jgi:amidophosphoribosyltransferase